jgi:very-short-patch-repair endonuclease
MNDWQCIREHYRRNTMAIYRAGRNDWGLDPYAWEHDAGIILSPIESALWCDLRAVGVVVYPQYPVTRYFVDFANPVARVAIECDGAAYHTDKQRDDARQADIEAEGWTVYRISGRDCKTDSLYTETEAGASLVQIGTARRFIQTIAERHQIRYDPRAVQMEIYA